MVVRPERYRKTAYRLAAYRFKPRNQRFPSGFCTGAFELTQRHRTGKRCNKRHLASGRQRQGHQASGCADIAKQCEHIIRNQFSGVFCAAVGLVAIVEITDFNQALAYPALRIELVKTDFGTLVKLNTQLRCRAREGYRLTQYNFCFRLGPDDVKTSECRATNGK